MTIEVSVAPYFAIPIQDLETSSPDYLIVLVRAIKNSFN